MKKIHFLLFFLLFSGIVLPGLTQEKSVLVQLDEVAIIDQKVMMPMRDGTRLATDIYRPKGDYPVPIVFSRTPYNCRSKRAGKIFL